MLLHHFTCEHAAPKIIGEGLVVPQPQPMLGWVELAWFTDDPTLPKDDLGLGSVLGSCDRMAVHFVCAVPDDPTDSPWPDPFWWPWRSYASARLRNRDQVRAASALELGRQHSAWFVSTVPIEWQEYSR